MMDVVQMWSEDDLKGTILEKNPKLREAFVGLWADAGPAFYLEHLKRLRQHAIEPSSCWRGAAGGAPWRIARAQPELRLRPSAPAGVLRACGNDE
jgi:hypothetical protein